MLLKMGVRVCPSIWYQMAHSRVLAHGLIQTNSESKQAPFEGETICSLFVVFNK